MKLRKLSTLKEKISEFPILKRPNFSKVFILHIDWSLLVLELLLANLMRKAKNMLSPMHPKETRLKATTLHTKGSALLLYGPSYISSFIFMSPISLCILTTSLSSG